MTQLNFQESYTAFRTLWAKKLCLCPEKGRSFNRCLPWCLHPFTFAPSCAWSFLWGISPSHSLSRCLGWQWVFSSYGVSLAKESLLKPWRLRSDLGAGNLIPHGDQNTGGENKTYWHLTWTHVRLAQALNLWHEIIPPGLGSFSLNLCYSSLGENSEHLTAWITVSEVSVHGQKFQYHGGRRWGREAVYFLAARKQRRGEAQEEGPKDEIHFSKVRPSNLPQPVRSHLLIGLHWAMNSLMHLKEWEPSFPFSLANLIRWHQVFSIIRIGQEMGALRIPNKTPNLF